MVEGLKFDVELGDKVTPNARHAASALHGMSKALDDASSHLAFYERQLARANQLGDVFGHKKYESLVADTKRKVFDLADSVGPKMQGHGGSFIEKLMGLGGGIHKTIDLSEVAHRAVESFGRGIKEAGSSLMKGELSGVVSGAAESLSGMAGALDLVVPGLGALAGGAIKAAGAVVGLEVEIVQFAVETAMKVSAFNNRFRESFGSGALATLNQLSARLPQSKDQIADWMRTFEGEGITDQSELRREVLATASAQAIMGEQGAEAYEHLTRKIRIAVEAHQGLKLGERPLEALYKMGLSVSDVAAEMGTNVKTLRQQLEAGSVNAQKFGNAISSALVRRGKGPLEAMAADFDTIKSKAEGTINALFAGVDVKPLTDAMRMVLEAFGQGQAGGKALKGSFTFWINGIVHELAEATINVTAFFLHMEARAIRLEVKMRPFIKIFKEVSTGIDAVLSYFEGSKAYGASRQTPAQRAREQARAGGSYEFVSEGVRNNKPFGHTEFRPFGPYLPGAGIPGQNAPNWVELNAARPSSTPPPVRPPNRAQMVQAVALAVSAAGGVKPTVNVGSINITAPDGVTDAKDLSATGLGSALERVQLMGAR